MHIATFASMGRTGPPIEHVAESLRELRDVAYADPGPGAIPSERARWAEASQAYDGLLLRAALMLDIPIGDASPVAPPVLSDRQRELLEGDLRAAGLDL